jgi:putative tricarboxylic transport membrane protein
MRSPLGHRSAVRYVLRRLYCTPVLGSAANAPMAPQARRWVEMASLERIRRWALVPLAALGLAFAPPRSAFAWEPSRQVELIVPAGAGGGADQMARFIQGVITKHGLMQKPLVVVNKSGGAGGEGFLDMKQSQGNPHKIIITLSNLFTTPLATGIPFSYRDLTPVAMLALDQFVLWVNAAAPQQTAQQYLAALRAGPDNAFSMGGTGSKQEDQLITTAIERVAGKKLTYVPFKGGGDVAVQLVGGHVNSTVNNPLEAVAHWRADKLRPLCVFWTERMASTKKVTASQSWNDIPTCKEGGIDVTYQMLRGIFLPGGATPEQVSYYLGVLEKVRALPEWQEFIETGAFDASFKTGADYVAWLEQAEAMHRTLMRDANFLAK